MSRSRTHSLDSGSVLPVLALALLFAGIDFALRSASQTPDGLSYARAARDGFDLFHPHHLLYTPGIWILHRGFGLEPIMAGVIQNNLWMIVLAFASMRWLRRWGWAETSALAATALLLACRGVMFYATHVETYLPSLACLAMLVAHWDGGPRHRVSGVLWLTLAVLYHQTNVLIVPALLVMSLSWKRDILQICVPAGVLTVFLYVMGWAASGVDSGFVAWTTSYARADVPAWGALSNLGGQGLVDLGANQLRMVIPVPAAASTPAGGLFLIGLAVLVFWHLRRRHESPRRRAALVWLGVYLPFFLWWIPSDPDFFLATLLPLWALALLALQDLAGAVRARWLIPLSVLLALGNLWFTGLPLSRSAGEAYDRAAALVEAAPARALLIAGYGVEQQLLYYFPDRSVREGDALGGRSARGEHVLEAGLPIVIDGEYVRRMLAREREEDDALMRALLVPGSEVTVRRNARMLPRGIGLLFDIGTTAIEDRETPRAAFDRLMHENP